MGPVSAANFSSPAVTQARVHRSFRLVAVTRFDGMQNYGRGVFLVLTKLVRRRDRDSILFAPPKARYAMRAYRATFRRAGGRTHTARKLAMLST